MDTRFDKRTALGPLPAYLQTTSSFENIRPTVAFYSEDLQNVEIING